MLRPKILAAVGAQAGGGGPDVTPDPISYATFDVGSFFYETEDQSILGIDTPITIRVDVSTGRDPFTMLTRVNGVNVNGSSSLPDSHTVTVENGDTLSFRFNVANGDRARPQVTLTNETDNNTVLTTFSGEIDNG